MKQLILTLSLILGLANSAFALDAGDRHADPFKVMTKGQVIGQDSYGTVSYTHLTLPTKA